MAAHRNGRDAVPRRTIYRTYAFDENVYDDRIPIDDADIVEGGLPKESSILPWAVASIESDRIDRELAALDEALVDDAVEQLGSYLSLEYPR